jgi:hypothetical protein
MIRLFLLFMATLILSQCTPKSDDMPLVEKDLLAYGIPITLQVPDSAEIKTMDFGVQKDITVKGPDWYNLQIFSSTASSSDMAKTKSEHLSIINDNPYFRNMVREEEDGFIFEMEIDSLQNYDFRHLKIQGDREYVFQAGLYGTFSIEDIEKLYQIAKEAK